MNLWFPLGRFDIVSFGGPDAVRFLNGQLTQDVRKVADGKSATFSCVTDAKGRLQFRVVITADNRGAILVAVPYGLGESLEARLTRYLIADDVEVQMAPGAMEIHHFIGGAPPPPVEGLVRNIARFGEAGCDWWIPDGVAFQAPAGLQRCDGDALESFRIKRGIPAWGREITEGMLPPEALLEATDISYQKGCYIGQEIISRMKSAGKVNRRLARFQIDGEQAECGAIIGANGKDAGIVTSIAPDSSRLALGFIKRNSATENLTYGGSPIRVI